MTIDPEDGICGAGMAWLSGLVESLALLPQNKFAEVASCPEICTSQPSNLGFGHISELSIPAPHVAGRVKSTPNSVVEQGCTHIKIV